MMSVRPIGYLVDLVVRSRPAQSCITQVHDRIYLLPSDRGSSVVEGTLSGMAAREVVIKAMFESFDGAYDIVLVDTAPSISVMHTCVVVYAQNLLMPVTLDEWAVQGAVASMSTAQFISKSYSIPVRFLGIIPVQVDKRLKIAFETMSMVEDVATQFQTPVLLPIRTDSSVNKATARRKAFLADLAPIRSKAYEDYTALGDQILEILSGTRATETTV